MLGQTQRAKDEQVIDRHSLCAQERLSLDELEWAPGLISRSCYAFILNAQHFSSASIRNALKQGRCNTGFLYAYLHHMSAAAHVAPDALRAYITTSIQTCGDTETTVLPLD